MKKMAALLMVLVLSLALVAGATAETNGGMKLGLQVDTTIAKSKDAEADANGLAQVDTVAVAVLVDAEGKIADLDIDAVQAKMPFTAQGTLAPEFPATVPTKQEMGKDYGMSTVSKVGEWDQQIAALSAYLIGKTVEEVKNVAVDESTAPTDTELTAGCTMKIGGYLSAVAAAMENAVDCAAAATDKVGIGCSTATSKSKDAADGKDGQCMAYSFFSALTTDANGMITACRIDSTQGTVKFDATGKITSDLAARTATKQELGEAYGMRSASGIGKEWFEQANAFAAYVIGKTAAEVEGIAVDESTKPTDTELAASVTVSVGGLQGAVVNAAAHAAK